MDYFSVVILVIVAYIYMTDRCVKDLETLKKEKQDLDIICEIKHIKDNIEFLKIKPEDMTYDNILARLKGAQKQYIFLQNTEVVLNESKIDTIIANYIVSSKRLCGFNVTYLLDGEKWSVKKIYVDILNYLNIFNKKDLASYGVILCTKEEFKQNRKSVEKQILSYTGKNIVKIEFKEQNIKKEKLKKIYLDKISKADIYIIIKILLLIFAGAIITSNLIYSLLNINNSLNYFVLSIVIYYCYLYIVRYIYKPIGKKRVLASYIFPIYFIIYIIVALYTFFASVIKRSSIT